MTLTCYWFTYNEQTNIGHGLSKNTLLANLHITVPNITLDIDLLCNYPSHKLKSVRFNFNVNVCQVITKLMYLYYSHTYVYSRLKFIMYFFKGIKRCTCIYYCIEAVFFVCVQRFNSIPNIVKKKNSLLFY